MNRRAFIAAAPTAALTAAFATGDVNAAAAELLTAGQIETPVLLVFREWVAAKKIETAAYAIPDNDAAQDAAWDACHEIEKRITATPSETINDWALKMAAWSNFGEGDCQDERQAPMLWAEARALIRVN